MQGYGEFIRKHRIMSGYKRQKDFADATGITPATISRIEDEKHRPAAETIQALAKKLHTTSLIELMVVCGHWNKDVMAMEERAEHSVEKEKETPPLSAEAEFLSKIELSEEELLEQFDFTLDGKELTVEEAKGIIAYVRALRMTR